MKPYYESPDLTLYHGDSREVLPSFSEGSVDSVVTDPPYELGFMGKSWDKQGVAFDPAMWTSVLRVLKPGGYLLCFGGTRTYHRLACAVEESGFELRDCLMWLFGTGFPKGQGCLKPAWEPILLARRPGKKVLPLEVDACRVPSEERPNIVPDRRKGLVGNALAGGLDGSLCGSRADGTTTQGRYPANVLHDGSEEVMESFAAFGEKTSGTKTPGRGKRRDGHPDWRHAEGTTCYADSGSAGRFFYCAKASKSERGKGNTHPTVKPLALMQWLLRLVTPVGGVSLDPFAGSGSSLLAGRAEGRRVIGIEQDAAHCAIAASRIGANPTPDAAPEKVA